MIEKKKWETPKLICLYRGKPEERVLLGCKSNILDGPGSSLCNDRGWCYARSDT